MERIKTSAKKSTTSFLTKRQKIRSLAYSFISFEDFSFLSLIKFCFYKNKQQSHVFSSN